VLFDFWVTLASVIAQHFYWKLPKFEFVAANVYGFVLKHFLYKFDRVMFNRVIVSGFVSVFNLCVII